MRTGKGEKTGVPGKNVFQKLQGKMISTEKLAAEAVGGWGQKLCFPAQRGSHKGKILCVPCRVGAGKPQLAEVSIGERGPRLDYPALRHRGLIITTR